MDLGDPLNNQDLQESRRSVQDLQQEVFVKISKAYSYLSNSVTKLLYDQFGIPGLIMYEKQKEHFEGLVDQLREMDSTPDKERDAGFEQQRKDVEQKILSLSRLYLKGQLRQMV